MDKPLISVILMHHLDENRKYLDLAIRGLDAQRPWNTGNNRVEFEIILISDAESYPEGATIKLCDTVIHSKEANTSNAKFNLGVARSNPDSKYFLFHSDDVVMGKGSLYGLSHHMLVDKAISCPMSNSDNGTRYVIEGVPGPDQEYEESGKYISQGSIAPSFLLPQPWVSFFCPLIPRKVWEAVGVTDPEMEYSCNDVQYCLRANQKGYLSVIVGSAFAFHFGSKTLSKIVSEEDKQQGRQAFEEWKTQFYDHGKQ